MNIRRLVWKNIISNPFNTILSILLMAFGVGIISLLLLFNNQVEKQLQNNLRGIDMVLGAKGSPLQLILSSIYHIDNPTGNISFKEADKLTKNPMVDFTIPLSYGDSYNGYRIVGTTFQYPKLYEVDLNEGELWGKSMEVVVGSVVAEINNLNLGDIFYGTHGLSEDGHIHDKHAYKVVGILKKSNSVMDKLIMTDIKSVWEVHNHEIEIDEHHLDGHHHHDHSHHQKDNFSDRMMITCMLVKFKSPVGLIQLPRKVNKNTNLQAAVPVFEINRLTNLLGFGIQTINLIALIIILVSGLSIFISLYNSLNRRHYDLALIRVHGATKWQSIKLVFLEGLMLSFIGTIFGLLISRLILLLMPFFVYQKQIFNSFGFELIITEFWLVLIALFVGFIASLIPAIFTYKIDIPKTLSNV